MTNIYEKIDNNIIYEFWLKNGDSSGGSSTGSLPGGTNMSVQYNLNDIFGGDNFLLYDYANRSFGLGSTNISSTFNIDDISGKTGLSILSQTKPLSLKSSTNTFNFGLGVLNSENFAINIQKPLEGNPLLSLRNLMTNTESFVVRGDNNSFGINLNINELPSALFHVRSMTAPTAIFETYIDGQSVGSDIRLYRYSSIGGDININDKIGSITFYARTSNQTSPIIYLESYLTGTLAGNFKIKARNNTNVYDVFTITSDPRVGILTNTPRTTLEIDGTFSVYSDPSISNPSFQIDTNNNIQIGNLTKTASITMFGGDALKNALELYTTSRRIVINGNGNVGIGQIDSVYPLSVDAARLNSTSLILNNIGINSRYSIYVPSAGTYDRGFYIKRNNIYTLFFSDYAEDYTAGTKYNRASLHIIDTSTTNIYSGFINYCDFSIGSPRGFTLLSRISQSRRNYLINDWIASNKPILPGLLIYNTTINEYEYFNGDKWIRWRDINVPNDPNYIAITNGTGGIYTSAINGTFFTYDPINNRLQFGTKNSSYHLINATGNNPTIVIAHDVHNAGTCGLAFSNSLGTTQYPHVGIFGVATGANGQTMLRFCAVGGGDTTTVTPNDWFYEYNPAYNRLTMRADSFTLYSNIGDAKLNIKTTNSNSTEVIGIVLQRGPELKQAIFSGNTEASYSRGDIRLCVRGDSVDPGNPWDTTNVTIFDVGLVVYAMPNSDSWATPDKRVGINRVDIPTCQLDINGDKIRLRNHYTPQVALDDLEGMISWDDNFLYVRTSVGWKKVALTAL